MFTSVAVWVLLLGAAAMLAGALGFVWGTGRGRVAGQRRLVELEGAAQAAGATVQELRRQLLQEREDTADMMAELRGASEERAALVARLEESERNLQAQRDMLVQAEKRLSDAFSSMAGEALRRNNESFLALAAEKLNAVQQSSQQDLAHRQEAIESLVKPVHESLNKVDEKIALIEKARGEAYGRLTAQVTSLADSQNLLRTETGNLVRALRAPAVRGRWGEMQLKRAVEMAGMLDHCDFGQQVTMTTSEGRLRPDMVVRLPAGRNLVVDAKVPLEAYLDAIAATTDEDRSKKLRDHAQQVRNHVQKLGAKSYWEQLSGSPEFVILFLPGEAFFSAALEASPSLLEEGVGTKVLIATPTTLIALLQTVQVSWREERLAENAQKISEQGRQLHRTLSTLFEHWGKLGRAINNVNAHFNGAVASLDGRVMPAARKLEELGASSAKELVEIQPIDARPRLVASDDMPDQPPFRQARLALP